MTDLDGVVAWTGAGDEGTTAGVFRIHADAGAGARAAALLDAALDVGWTGAVAGFVVALGRAVAGLLACAGFTRNGAFFTDGAFSQWERHESCGEAGRRQAKEGDDIVHDVWLEYESWGRAWSGWWKLVKMSDCVSEDIEDVLFCRSKVGVKLAAFIYFPIQNMFPFAK